MSRYNDDNGFDGSGEADPVIRELRTEIVRLEAQLDQLTASVRERARESTEIRAKLAELEEGLERLRARRQRDEKLLILAWVMMMVSLGMSLYTFFTA